MHAWLLHIYDHALLHPLFIGIYPWGSVMALCVCNFCLNKDRSFVMLTSSVRLCSFLRFEASEWFLVCWHIASCSYMSSHMAFLAINMELSGTTRQVPSFGIQLPCLLLNFRENWLARLGIFSRVKLACSACCVLDVECRFCVNFKHMSSTGPVSLVP
jgi:hypothetical protein